MPEGSVIRWVGKRGVVWRIKFRDATGRQVQQTLGSEAEGWTEKKARRELKHRVTDVEREGWTRIEPETFETFARRWLAAYPATKGLKRSTRESYETIAERHLIPAFGPSRLDAIDARAVESYVAGKRRAGFGPRSVNRQLNLLGAIFKSAAKQGLARSNPVADVERPREPEDEWRILTPAEVGRVARAFEELAAAAAGEERAWREQARTIFLTVATIGLRRGEVLGLRWRDVDLADPAGAVLRVRETIVRGRLDTPKSRRGRRTIPLGPVVAEELWQHRRRTAFQGDDERVFVSPTKGTAVDYGRYAKTLALALAKAKIEGRVRPFHDGRHTSITNAAAAGASPEALMTHAGHASYATTRRYINLTGAAFRAEAERAEARLLGAAGTKTRYKVEEVSPVE